MFERIHKIYFVGIKGVAMAGLASIFKKMGKQVTGSDVGESFITDDILTKNNIKVLAGFKGKNIPSDTDLIVYSAAHRGVENHEVQTGLKLNIKALPQAQIIGELMKNFKKNIAVCGSHGKTTTSSLLSYALIKLNQNPSYLVGAPSFTDFDGSDFNNDKYFVIEADEYAVNPPLDKTIKLNFLNPNYILATNIDFDHPDIYKNLEEVKHAFLQFFKKLVNQDQKIKRLFYCCDDINLKETVGKLPGQISLSFGYSEKADLQIMEFKTSVSESIFQLKYQGQPLGTFTTSLFGKKNISNAAGVVLFLINQGFDIGKIREAIKGFAGARRRFEQVAFVNNMYLFDDYAHHPEEIISTIDAARARFPKKRIILIFQPHTYSRTESLKEEFAHALSKADFSLILPIFSSAREKKEEFNVTSHTIEEIAKKNSVKSYNGKEELLHELKRLIKPGDTLFTMGAGDIYKLKNDIINIIQSKDIYG